MNPTERLLTRKMYEPHEVIDEITAWLEKHHGPLDAGYLRSFLTGACEHPYQNEHVCDLCEATCGGYCGGTGDWDGD